MAKTGKIDWKERGRCNRNRERYSLYSIGREVLFLMRDADADIIK